MRRAALSISALFAFLPSLPFLPFFPFFALSLAACGAGEPSPRSGARPAKPAASARASAAASPSLPLSPPPSGLPPLAPMPPPGVVGSKKATKKTDAALWACGGGANKSAKDPADLVKRLGEACASTSKMTPLGPVIRGQEGEKDPHQEHKVRVEANKCYRVVFATDENVKDAVLAMRDSAGDMVAESPSAALPADGTLCFSTSDEVTLLVGVGTGKGAYAAQVWGN